MDVLHERGQHSAVPLLDSANNCDREFGRARVSGDFFTTETRRHGGRQNRADSRYEQSSLLNPTSIGKKKTDPFLFSSVPPCLRGEKEVYVNPSAKFPLPGGRTLTNR